MITPKSDLQRFSLGKILRVVECGQVHSTSKHLSLSLSLPPAPHILRKLYEMVFIKKMIQTNGELLLYIRKEWNKFSQEVSRSEEMEKGNILKTYIQKRKMCVLIAQVLKCWRFSAKLITK